MKSKPSADLSFEIPKSDKVKVVAAIIDWPPDSQKSERVLDIRTYVFTQGKWIPTPKGTQIPIVDGKKFFVRLRKILKHEFGEE